MAEVMMALGDFRFSVNSAAYDSLRRSDEFRWASQDVIGREPALQYLGLGKTTVEMSGTIHPHYKGGLRQIDRMRTEARKGEPLRWTDALGNANGLWVIVRIEETQSRHLANGAPLKVEFRIELGRYGS